MRVFLTEFFFILSLLIVINWCVMLVAASLINLRAKIMKKIAEKEKKTDSLEMKTFLV